MKFWLITVGFTLLNTTLFAWAPDTLKIGNTTFLTDINSESVRIWIVRDTGRVLLLDKDQHGFAREEFEGYCFTSTCTLSHDTLFIRSTRLEWDEEMMSQNEHIEDEPLPAKYLWTTEIYLLRDDRISPMKWIGYAEKREDVDMRYTNCPPGS